MFTFKGVSSKDLGLKIVSLPPITSADERVDKIEIPNYDGVRYVSNGYSEVVREVMVIYEGTDFDRIKSVLRGEGDVIFDNEKDRYYKARIINKISFDELIRNKIYKFPIVFECQPYGYLLEGKNKIVVTEATEITNPGNVESYPIIEILGKGNIDLIIGQQVIKLINIEGAITLNSIDKEAYNGTALLNNKVNGEFPKLPTDKFSINILGEFSQLNIFPFWRCV